MQHLALVNDLDADGVLQIFVGRAADMQVDLGVVVGDLEVPLAKHMVLALLQRHEIACVLLAHKSHLRDQIVLLRNDRNLAHRGTNPERVPLWSHHVRLHPDRVQVGLLVAQAHHFTLVIPSEGLINLGHFSLKIN